VSDIVPRRRVLLASAAALPLLLRHRGLPVLGPVHRPRSRWRAARPSATTWLTLQAVIAAEENMIDFVPHGHQRRFGEAAGKPGGGTLRALLAQHEQHLVRLKARLIVPPGMPASPSPSSGGTASSSPRASTISIARLRAGRSARQRRTWCGGWPPRRPPWPSCSRASRLPTPRT